MSKFVINRPIVAMVLALFTVARLWRSAAHRPIFLIAPAEIQISAIYVGADAQTIEQAMATPIEQQMSGVDNINYMYALGATANGQWPMANGQMRMIIDFEVSTDTNTDFNPGAKPP